MVFKRKKPDIVDAGVEDSEVPKPPKGFRAEDDPVNKLHPELRSSVDELQKKFSGLYDTPVSNSAVQRDEMNTLLLALYHESRITNGLLREIMKE